MKRHTADIIPLYLETPPTSRVDPPVRTREQVLPLEKLSWENFERLCYRLVRLDKQVEHCQLYGVPGQKQEGIDLFARKRGGQKYSVYQCKREKGFGPAKIKKAVAEFLEGKWVHKTESLFLCTTESLRSIDRARAIEGQNAALHERGIKVQTWDCEELSAKLKDYPALVDDFFDREWVKEFCGLEAAKWLGGRLDGSTLRFLRDNLRSIYSSLFNRQYPWLPGLTLDASVCVAIEDRFVVPDVETEKVITNFEPRDDSPPDSSAGDMSKSPQRWPYAEGRSPAAEHSTQRVISQRQSIASWIPLEERSIVVGEAGSGKSTLLQFLALDLLHESPSLPEIARKWGEYVPVWVPFPFWTKMISDSGGSGPSLPDMLRQWFHLMSAEDLWPLVERALSDKRLLLLIDGLDEWTDESAAKIALNLLHLFIDRRNLPAVAAARPIGFRRLGMQQVGWQRARLAGFSTHQQKELVAIWFRNWEDTRHSASGEVGNDLRTRITSESEAFVSGLGRSNDLSEMARVPLLLGLLTTLHLDGDDFPRNRFEAYRAMIEHLISDHPGRRRTAALLTGDLSRFSSDDFTRILAFLAYQLHEWFPRGQCPEKRAENLLQSYLEDRAGDYGLPRLEARRSAEHLLELAVQAVGILVKGPENEIGFSHPSFEEYLAGLHLSTKPMSEQMTVVESRCFDPQWREVLLAQIYVTDDQSDAERIVECVRNRHAGPVEIYARESLLAEIAFGPFRCPDELAREIAEAVFREIEIGDWLPHRRHLLHLAMDGQRSPILRQRVEEKVTSWFPCRIPWWKGVFKEMKNWPPARDVLECLWRGLLNEEVAVQRDAGQSLAHLAGGEEGWGRRIADLAKTAPDHLVRASATKAFQEGWPDHPDRQKILGAASTSRSPELRLVSIMGRIQAGEQSRKEWEDLLVLTSVEAGLDFHWREDVSTVILKGWPGAPELKQSCIDILRSGPGGSDRPDDETVLRVLMEGYPEDSEVAEVLAALLHHRVFRVRFTRNELWELLCRNFQMSRLVSRAIAHYLSKRQSAEYETFLAAQYGHVDDPKSVLLSLLKTRSPQHAARLLLDRWGMKDEEVSSALRAMAQGPTTTASPIAHLLPTIMEDRSECKKLLSRLLQDPDCTHPHFVIEGLRAMGEVCTDGEIIDAVLKIDLSVRDRKSGLAKEALLLGFSHYGRVRRIARQELRIRDSLITAIASVYGNDEEIRCKVIEICNVLPTGLRHIVAQRLGEKPHDSNFSVSVLRAYNLEVDQEVKTDASIGFYSLLRASGNAVEEALESCSREIAAIGQDAKETRIAAFTGLLVLDRLDVMQHLKDPINPQEPCAIFAVSGSRRNYPFLRQLVTHWGKLKTFFGDELWTRLRVSDRLVFWEAICRFVDKNSDLSREILEDVQARRILSENSNLLHFIARMKPQSNLLLDWCMGTLFEENPHHYHKLEEQMVAAELLGEHFGKEPAVFDLLKSKRSQNQLDEAFLLALCEGWPDSQELTEIWNIVIDRYRELSSQSVWSISCRKSSSEGLFRMLCEFLAESSSHLNYWHRYYVRPLVRRLGTDRELRAMMLKRLIENSSASEKATFPKLLVDAPGMSPELESWCVSETNHQLTSNYPEIGFDLYQGQIRSVSHCLLDALQGRE